MNKEEVGKVRKEVLDRVFDTIWEMDTKFFDLELNAIIHEHKALEEEYRHKCEAMDAIRVKIEEMRW